MSASANPVPTAKPSVAELLIEEAGGPKAVSDHFGISLQAVYKWIEEGVPPKRVLGLIALAKSKRTPQEIRPDVFGPVPAKRRTPPSRSAAA